MKQTHLTLLAGTAMALVAGAAFAQEAAPPLLRAGIVGLDTSHVPAFTKLFNDPNADGDLAGVDGSAVR